MSVFRYFLHKPKPKSTSSRGQRHEHVVEHQYTEQALQKIFAAAFENQDPPDVISFKEFVEGCNKSGHVEWLQCPLFPLDDMATLSTVFLR